MNEHPLIFSGPMVRALLEGRKTMTRRLAKRNKRGEYSTPYAVGHTLWVKETFGTSPYDPDKTVYAADGGDSWPRWKPSIFMPRAFSRITLEVTAIRLERLQDITEADAIAEGIEVSPANALCGVAGVVPFNFAVATVAFAWLWQHIHGPGAWDRNPLVWVITFRRV